MKKTYIAPESRNLPLSTKAGILGGAVSQLTVPITDELADRSTNYVKEENGKMTFEENIFKRLDVWGEEW